MVEALLFASEAPLSAAELARADESLDEESVENAVAELRGEYDQDERAFQIFEVGGGYQLLTRPEFAPVLERFDSVPATQRLSELPLETTWSEVWEAALRMQERLAEIPAVHTVHGRPVKIEDQMNEVVDALALKRRVEFAALVEKWGTRIHSVATLLACLELGKRSVVRLRQAQPFSALWIYRARERAAAESEA